VPVIGRVVPLRVRARREVVCDDRAMAAILEHVRRHYSDDYALVLFASDVQVLRAEKF
jgi:beta-lactamase regulating signal transducer with metallopeptidase domain